MPWLWSQQANRSDEPLWRLQGLCLLQQGMRAFHLPQQGPAPEPVSMDSLTVGKQECQVKGWAEKGHKSSCKVMRGPRLSSLLKLDFPSDPPSIPSASSVVESAIRELRSLGLLGTR